LLDRSSLTYACAAELYMQLEAPYFPVWQMTPVLPPGVVDLINADMGKFDFAKNSLRATVATGKATLDVFTDLLSNTTEDASVFDIFLQSSQYRHSTETYTGEEPVSSLIYPVFDNFGEDKKVVGALYSTLYWKFLFSKILPPAVEGIVCVLENDLGQAVSYQINGPEVIFIGHGDQHDTTYDDLGKSVKIAEYMLKASNPETRSFTAVDLNDDYLGYTLHIYPSTTYENIYITGEALQGTLVIAGIFGVVIGMFVIYDCCVQKRQKIVMDRAVRATAVVSSLYPETIRDQIINDDANDVKQQPSRAQTFMRKSTEGIGNGSSRPLASKHPACTVYFADLAGFTKWSSTRQPEQVFQLLEALFKEFDAAALRRGVFKVETIGDCYMAVTGLPQAQPDHALRMAKFAHDCMHKIDQVTAELSKTLGEGTDDLTLRAGMHSGEVTGGVLRGEKGRFQLFGDTVNTASRMESTGIPRQIQISQSTADALILDGKENWLVPREEKVFAKGKGELQTYFLEVKERSFSSSDRASTTSASTSSGKS
jgi:class 3 adenylate cyclase